MIPNFEGLIAATFTPMTAEGALDLSRIPPLAEHLVGVGVSGLYVSGTTGEGESLTADERKESARAYINAVRGRVPVIVQVGRNSIPEARSCAEDARSIGADAIAVSSPSFFKPASVDALAACVVEVAAGAPDLPVYYYHLPRMTGVEVDVAELLSRAGDRATNLRGVKYSAPDFDGLAACLQLDGGRFDVLFGCDELLLTGLETGARAAVGSTYNFSAPIYHAVIEAFNRGDTDEAQGHQRRAVEIVDVVLSHGGLPAMKAAMSMLGHECGPVRLPLVALTEAERDALREDLDAAGFFSG